MNLSQQTQQQMTDSYAKRLKDIHEVNSVCEILPNRLYLGSALGANDIQTLKSLGVTHIVNVCTEIPNYHPHDFVYKKVEIYDVEDSEEQLGNEFPAIHEFMHGKTVFVHCVQGISRSASCVLSYLMKYEKMTLRQAFEHTRQRRPEIHPNDGFIHLLMKIELQVHPDLKNENTWSNRDMLLLEAQHAYPSLPSDFIKNTLVDKQWDLEKCRRIFFMKSR